MKKAMLFFGLVIVFIQFSIFNSVAQNRQVMMDSCDAYQQKHNYEEAIKWAKLAVSSAGKEYGQIDTSYAKSLEKLIELFFQTGKLDSALVYQEEHLKVCREIYKADHPDLASGINNMAYLYQLRARYSEAEELYKESLEMLKRIYKDDHPDLATIINNMGSYYNAIGRFSEAEQLYKEALEMRRRLSGEPNPDLATSINNMALLYRTRGNYKEAMPLLEEALEMFRKIFNGDNYYLATCISNLAEVYIERGKFTEAEPLLKESLEMKRRIFKVDNQVLAAGINNLAGFYYVLGRFSEAEPLFKENLEMARRIFKTDHPELANGINNIAMLYSQMGKYSEAEQFFKESLEIKKRLFKNDHPDLAYSTSNLAHFYELTGRNPEAEPLFTESMQIYMNILNNYFPYLSEKEKKQFWNTFFNRFEGFNQFAIKRSSENPLILCNMYDIQLYSKALLFNSQNRIKSRILSSGDSVIAAQYQNWSEMREYLVQLYKMTEAQLTQSGISLDSIEKAANELEKRISLKSEDFKESYEMKKVTWKSIQTLLKPDEAAVEVVRFKLIRNKQITDTICYAFLIVTDKTEDHPDLVLLENGKQLEGDYYDEHRKMISLKAKDVMSFQRFWGKLYDKLKDYRKIYFSADGIYNKLNPSTLMMPDGKFLLDLQDIQQVNSTKDMILGYYRAKEESNIYNSAVLIGNPNYKLGEEEVKMASRRIRGDNNDSESNKDLLAVRGIELTPLPGTEKEVKEIEKFLTGKKWDVKSYLGNMALKSAVKMAESPRVLHIATHGLFLEDVKSIKTEIFGFEEDKLIENPLLRSGLFFTGANSYLNSEKETFAGDENGILTAYEAMNLDLDKTELVVLSACETGLGDIQNGEGVFGLRRAFQQAGAKTVIMSLWSVSDQATQELMSKFYSNWASGMTKREAFAGAQQEVRGKYPDPYYWGAFVMVGE